MPLSTLRATTSIPVVMRYEFVSCIVCVLMLCFLFIGLCLAQFHSFSIKYFIDLPGNLKCLSISLINIFFTFIFIALLYEELKQIIIFPLWIFFFRWYFSYLFPFLKTSNNTIFNNSKMDYERTLKCSKYHFKISLMKEKENIFQNARRQRNII